MTIKASEQRVSIVTLGKFSPDLFSPAWLHFNEIILKEEMDAAEVKAIIPDICQIIFPEMNLTVERERLILETASPPWVRLPDFISRLFASALHSTPIARFGINTFLTYKLTRKELNNVGKNLAPRGPWGSWGMDIDGGRESAGNSGLVKITMKKGHGFPDRPSGGMSITVTTEGESLRVSTNDHFELSDESPLDNTDCINLLTKVFEGSVTRSVNTSNEIVERNRA